MISKRPHRPAGKPAFSLTLKVRDYECDLQGIVNNANYQHYTEHTRNEFLRTRLEGMEALHARGIDTVVSRVELRFRSPLRPADVFRSDLWVQKVGVKYAFYQEIVRVADERLCLQASTDIVCVVNGRLDTCPELDVLLPAETEESHE